MPGSGPVEGLGPMSGPAPVPGGPAPAGPTPGGTGSPERPLPGRGVPISSLILTSVTALTVGMGLYRLLASVTVSFDPFSGLALWGTVVLIGLCLGPFACALGVVSAVRCRRRPIGWIALVTAFVLPVVAGSVGLAQGVDKFSSSTVRTVTSATGGIACLVGEEGWEGLDSDSLRKLLDDANE